MADEEIKPEPLFREEPTSAPAADEAPQITYRERLGYHYPVASGYTGKVQFRYDAGAEVSAPPSGTWLRAEVKAIGSKAFADRLVQSGLHSHVAADTPLGQPDKYKARPAETKE